MVINDREFPVVVQAYQPSANGELFVAEQMVRNQVEVDAFSSRYAGYVIKARVVKENEMVPEYSNDNVKRRMDIHRRGIPAWAIFLLIVVVLVVVGFTTGWIQRTFELNL
jgi:type VI protein secretion system component VasF